MRGKRTHDEADRSEFEYKLVVVVSTDITLSPGKMAAQVGHASVTCALETMKKNKKLFRRWYDEGQRKVVLKAPLSEIFSILKELENEGNISWTLVKDAGLTEIPPGTITCLGVGPGPEKLIDRYTGHLKLR